jgi:putative endonuclease
MKFGPVKRPFHLSLGERGEMAGWKYLLDQGYKILEKNFRCPLGEIDVIAEKDKRILFVEIKTRSDSRFGTPQEAVTAAKQARLVRLAEWYLQDRKKQNASVSFEVLAVSWDGARSPAFQLIRDAFVQE